MRELLMTPKRFVAISAIMMFTIPSAAPAAERPNVLFIAVDDLNDWIGCLGGHPDCRTPNIDRLAARGMLFTRSYCAAPACNPSRVALLTGVRPSASGVYHNPQPFRPVMPDAVTLPQRFRQAGYHVVGSGKIFHGGFDDPQSWDEYRRQTPDPMPSADVTNDPHSRAGGIIWGPLDVPDKAMNDYKVASFTAEYLREDRERPFFLACGIYRPHMPWQVPREYYVRYPLDGITLPRVPDFDDLADVPPAGVRMAKPKGDHRTVTNSANWPYAVQAYLASIAFADVQIGRVLDALDAGPHVDDTIVVLWGDHGWHLGEKQHWRKFALWEEATRAPLMIVAPGVTQPHGVCERTVDFTSIYPTLCELCELDTPDTANGESIVPLLRDPQARWTTPALTTHGRGNHAVRSERYRYIRYADGSEELYDHQSDPNEWHNLADAAEHRNTIAELAAWLPATEAEDAPTTKPRKKPSRAAAKRE